MVLRPGAREMWEEMLRASEEHNARARREGRSLGHLEAVEAEYADLEALALLQHGRQEISLDVARVVRGRVGSRRRAAEFFKRHKRVLITGARSVTTKLVAHLAMR